MDDRRDRDAAAATAAGEASGPAPAAAVVLRGITKRFGAVVACADVDLTVQRGEIHGLLGENGAGKSTLMKILTGVVPPDAGQIVIDGRSQAVDDPLAAAALGMAMVHQHFSLVDALTVWENVTLGERGRIDARRAVRQVEEIGGRYGLAVDPRARVRDLSPGQRQRVEIIKCLRRDPTVVILDEPTSVLTMHESRELFAVLRETVVSEGRAVVLISHKLEEILSATDRVTIMRAGAVVGSHPTAQTSAAGLARAMVGRDVSLRADAAALGLLTAVAQEVVAEEGPSADAGSLAASSVPTLRIRDAVATGPDGRVLLDGLSLDVRAGEIVGLAGVEGNGQSALGDVLSSIVELRAGCVEVDGRPVATGRAGHMGEAGIGVVPEDRHGSGCVLAMTVAENLVLDDLGPALAGRWISPRRLRAHAERLIAEFGIQTSSWDAPMWSLSGGNQQRVVLARELSRRPRVLVAAQPTRGLDVGAIEYMSARLRAAAADGVAVLLVSTELEEILALSDRVAVIHRGRIVGEMARHAVDVERLGLLMGGAGGVTDLVEVVSPASTAAPEVLSAEEVARRLRVGRVLAVGLYLVALAAAIGAAVIVVELTGGSPMAVVRAVHAGSFQTWPAVGQTLDQAAPLALVALGTVVTNRAGLVNIGQEGQVLVGGLAGVAVGLHLGGPRGVVVPVVLLAAAAGGAAWAGVAAALRFGRRVNEVISTLLLIYVAGQLVTWMVTRGYLLREQKAAGQSNDQTERLATRAQLPHFGRFDQLNLGLGVFIAFVVVVVGGFLLARSRFGFRLRVLGHNPTAAQRAGVSTARTGTAAMLIGGGLAGLAGGVLLTGTVFRVSGGFANNVGWQGLLVALIARNRPGAVLAVALFFGALRNSTLALAASGTPRDIVDVVQALLVLGAILPPVYLTVRERRLRRQLATARA